MHTENNEFRRFHEAGAAYLSSDSLLRAQLKKDIELQTDKFLKSGGTVRTIPNFQQSTQNLATTFNNQQAKATS